MASINTAAVYVEKGGVGKTTSAVHIAAAATRFQDHDTLVIDLAGTQNDVATHLGLEEIADDINTPVSAVFREDWETIREHVPAILDRMTFATDEDVDVIPADPGLGGADVTLSNIDREDRFDKLAAFVEDLVAPAYDLVIFDLPGGEDNIVLNGLFAAENVVAPLRPGSFEQTQLQSLDEDLDELRESTPIDARLAMVLPTMIDRREDLSENFATRLQEAYPERCGPPIARTANIGAAQTIGQTLFAMADDEIYSTGERAREAYREATDQLLTEIHD